MPTNQLPWRYRDDAYYQKGAFEVEFRVAPEGPEAANEEARRRALQQLLLALRDETGLKVSSFVDVWGDDEAADELLDEVEQFDDDFVEAAPEDELEPDPDAVETASAELVIYNKLGVTSLAKLRRFMEQHLKGDLHPRVILIDPETNDRFRATEFTIRYLFTEFIAHQPPDDWDRLRELLTTEDRGYRELTRTARTRNQTRNRRIRRASDELYGYRYVSMEDFVLDLIDFVRRDYDDLETHQDIVAEVRQLAMDDYLYTEVIPLYLRERAEGGRLHHDLDPDFNWPRGGGTMIELLLEGTAAYVAEVAWRLLKQGRMEW